MKKTVYILMAALLALVACEQERGMDAEMLSIDEYALEVNGKMVQTFGEGQCQLSYNATRKEFRVGDDKMAEYYLLQCNKVPTAKGETLTADLQWTMNQTVQKRPGVKFRVEKIDENGRIWLWASKEDVGVIIYKPQ